LTASVMSAAVSVAEDTRRRSLRSVPVVRAVIDSMVFDAIVEERDGLRAVDRLTNAGRLQLLAAATTMAEIAAVADEEHRRRLQKVRVLVLPPPQPHVAFRGLMRAPGVGESDARIALTAAEHGVPLVTEDRDLRVAAAAHLPELILWRWADDLRPRIAAL
jgi:predicted nucleic acid-binding protein